MSTQLRIVALFTLTLFTLLLWSSLALSHHVQDYLTVNTTVEGKIYRIIDGDTFKVKIQKGAKKKGVKLICRLALIDAPEIGQPLADEAKKALDEKVGGKSALLDIVHLEALDNIAIVIVRLNGRNINLEMVSEGRAEAYKEFLRPPYKDAFLIEEAMAKAEKKGIWGLSNYERPSVFRKNKGVKSPFVQH